MTCQHPCGNFIDTTEEWKRALVALYNIPIVPTFTPKLYFSLYFFLLSPNKILPFLSFYSYFTQGRS